ncbi:MAG: hypothetical protein ACFE9C_09715 [Candidatus Hodarchaeota archaeon]
MSVTIGLGGWKMLFPRPPPTGEFLKEITHILAEKGFFYAGAEILFKRIADFPNLEKFPNLTGRLRLCISDVDHFMLLYNNHFRKILGEEL